MERDALVVELRKVQGVLEQIEVKVASHLRKLADPDDKTVRSEREILRFERLSEDVGIRLHQIYAELASVCSAIAAEIILWVRVILCTVTAASRSLLIDEDLAPAVRRITSAILDEAGTCSEPNMPLLLLLPRLKRIIAIGDQKQLAPLFNMKVDGGGEAGGVCFAFQKGHGIYGQCKFASRCRFSHVRTPRGPAAQPGGDYVASDPLGFF